jgi:hypothetical protein
MCGGLIITAGTAWRHIQMRGPFTEERVEDMAIVTSDAPPP